jgi:uncharacterized protein YaiL (DUF2058 family)
LIFHGDDEKKEILNQDQKGKREQKSKLAKWRGKARFEEKPGSDTILNLTQPWWIHCMSTN